MTPRSNETAVTEAPARTRLAPNPVSLLDSRGPPPLDASPAIVADLMISALLRPGGGLVCLDPAGSSALLALRRSNTTLAELTMPGDVAAAAIGRLARMAGIDLLVERDSLTRPRAARLAVKVGADALEVLVTLSTTALGMSAELRLLSLQGRVPEHRPFAQLKKCISCGAYEPSSHERCGLDGAALLEVLDDPRPGGTIGAYVLLSVLGEGAMGVVFAAEHAFLQRRVAIKVLRARIARDPAFESRFLFEARATSRLCHPSVVEVTDYGVLATGSPFIVMERLDGESLERRIARGPLTPGMALRIARATALGLSAAHDGGVVHNDLKPSNVILLGDSSSKTPRLKIIDFGAASLAGAEDDGMVLGTPAFMAPERIYGEPSDVRSDSYSLGVMLYQMLSGRLPFDAKDSLAMFSAHTVARPKPLTSASCVLPTRVVRIVAQALEKKPSERYQTMRQMIVDLDHAIASFDAAAWRQWLP